MSQMLLCLPPHVTAKATANFFRSNKPLQVGATWKEHSYNFARKKKFLNIQPHRAKASFFLTQTSSHHFIENTQIITCYYQFERIITLPEGWRKFFFLKDSSIASPYTATSAFLSSFFLNLSRFTQNITEETKHCCLSWFFSQVSSLSWKYTNHHSLLIFLTNPHSSWKRDYCKDVSHRCSLFLPWCNKFHLNMNFG